MAGINPATGRFDPYYYAPNTSGVTTTVKSSGGTFTNTKTFVNTGGGQTQPVNPTYVVGGTVVTPNPTPTPAPSPRPTPTPTTPTPTPTAPSNPVYATGATRTQRRTGGWVDVLQQMSDGTWQVVDSYQDMSARDSVLAMFRAAGLGEEFINGLMAAVDGVYAQNVMPTDAQILNSIYNSQAYKTRFAANEQIRARMANGKGRPGDRLLTPKEYLDLENSYKQYLQEAGMPTGFYDQQEDFTKLIANGVSVGELKARIDTAYEALNYADDNVKNALQRFYGLSTGDLVAYLLDPTRAQPLLMGRQGVNDMGLNDRTALEKTYRSAELAGEASRMGESASKGLTEEIVNLGRAEQGKQAMAGAQRQADDVRRLGSLYGEGSLNFEGLVRESLNLTGGAEVGRKRKKFASKERAAFSGQSALDRRSLTRRKDA